MFSDHHTERPSTVGCCFSSATLATQTIANGTATARADFASHPNPQPSTSLPYFFRSATQSDPAPLLCPPKPNTKTPKHQNTKTPMRVPSSKLAVAHTKQRAASAVGCAVASKAIRCFVAVALTLPNGYVAGVQSSSGGVFLPSGEVQAGEGLRSRACRSVFEGTGVSVNPYDLVPVSFTSRFNGSETTVFHLYEASTWNGHVKGLSWINPFSLPANMGEADAKLLQHMRNTREWSPNAWGREPTCVPRQLN